ncbi:MAG: hypothetical protein A2096_03025 [Spirochaetes bacterium GWF1_41_5]|nr:MAG: hypothetical protein A2096_03025 [Spirochaetes bacterium GWF1_41_5]HBE03223.1 hypothetical protein [Spirochaetia bacterium]
MNRPGQNRTVSSEFLKIHEISGLEQHDVIYSVTTGLDGNIYFAPSSEFYPGSTARIFSFCPSEKTLREVVNVETLTGSDFSDYKPSHSKIHVSMVTGKDGIIYAATHLTAPPRREKYVGIYETYGDPKRGYPGSVIIAYNPKTQNAVNLGRVCPFEGARVMTIDKERDILYIISMPKSHLYSFDIKKRFARDLGRVSMENSLGLECDYRGFVFFTDDEGRIVRYDPEKDIIERLSIQIPDAPWRNGKANYVRRTALSPDGKTIWGCGTKSVRLFAYKTDKGAHGEMVDHGFFLGTDNYGRWPDLLACKAMCFGRDGKIYIAFSEDEALIASGNCRICSFDPAAGIKRDFGIITGKHTPEIITALDASADNSGNIYFGTRIKNPPPQLAVFTPPPDNLLDEVSDILNPGTSCFSEKDICNWIIDNNASGFSAAHKQKKGSPYVQEGSVTLRELGWNNLGLKIPDGESRITALICLPDGKIYGATSGRRSHLFLFNPAESGYYKESFNSCPMEIRVIEDAPAICRSMAADKNGIIYLGTISGTYNNPAGGCIYSYNPENETHIWEEHGLPRRPFLLGAENVKIIKIYQFANEGITALAIDHTRNILYGITCPGSNFFAYNLQTKKITLQIKLEALRTSQSLLCDADGYVYGSFKEGSMFRFNPEKKNIEDINIKLPAQKGREYLSAVNSFTVGADNLIYGGTTDGNLFSYDKNRNFIRSIGKPAMNNGIPALCSGNDYRIYGINGTGDDIARLFCYDIKNNDCKDLGILQASGIPKFWVGHCFESMATGLNGEIYIGESDRISHLFIYYPSIKQ